MSNERESPAVEWMQRMRLAFQQAVTEDDMREIAKGLVKRAKEGDRRALDLLLTYAMPKEPAQSRHERVSATVQAYGVRPKALPNGAPPRVVDSGE